MSNAPATVPASHADILDTNALAMLATVGPDGAPQVNPVWFGWDGTNLKISIATIRQKYRNVVADPRVALTIVDKENPYRYLEIRGNVVRIDPDPTKAYIDIMAKKYLGVDRYPWHNDQEVRVTLVIEPERVLTMG